MPSQQAESYTAIIGEVNFVGVNLENNNVVVVRGNSDQVYTDIRPGGRILLGPGSPAIG